MSSPHASLRQIRGRIAILVLALALVPIVFAACGKDDDDDGTPSGFEPDVLNHSNNFEVLPSSATNATRTLIYQWENTAPTALVEHATATAAGEARLRIYDAGGVNVYDVGLLPNAAEITFEGEAGIWRIEIVVLGFTGTLAFHVQAL